MSKVAARIEKVKTNKEMTARERHNKRSGSCKSSDKDREHLNEYRGVEGIAKHINTLEKQMNANLKAQGKRALRKDAIKLIEVIVSSDKEFFDKYDHKDYFNVTDSFLEQFWGQGNVIGEYLHLDEGTPHKHYFVTPIKDDKFNYSSFINGKNDLSKFQEELYNYVKERGFEVDERQKAEVTQKKHMKTREWSANMQKAESMVELMDDKVKTEYAIKGYLAEQESDIHYNRLEELTEENKAIIEENKALKRNIYILNEKYSGLRSSVYKATGNNLAQVEEMERQGIHQNRLIAEQKRKEKEHLEKSKMLSNEEIEV